MLIFSKKLSLNVEMIFTKIHSGLILSAIAVCIITNACHISFVLNHSR